MAALRPHERAVLRTFAQALIPPGGQLPGADVPGGAAIVGRAEGVVENAGPRVRLGIRAGLRAFEWSSFPRRFSQMPEAERVAYLARIEARGRGPRHELFGMLKTLVALVYGGDEVAAAVVGSHTTCELAEGAEPQRPQRSLRDAGLGPADGSERCDVVIVGSGAGGAVVARTLAEAGLSVIVVEEGEYYDASNYSSGNLYRDGGLTVCEGLPMIPMPVGRCVGGTTVINSGTCFRTPDRVLADWRDTHGIDWATDLEREFEQIERDLDVRPVDPATAGRNAELCRIGAEAVGASNGPISRNAGAVKCCSSCPNGCQLDAKQAMHVSELPRAVAAGARIRAGAKVERILFEGTRAVGVAARTAAGRYEVRARAVVLAAGAIGTPELLLSQGVADFSGQIGRNLRIHPACWVGARFDEQVRGWDGIMQSWYVDEWHDRGLFMEATFTPFEYGLHWLPGSGEEFKRRIAQYGEMGIIGVHMSDHDSQGRVTVGRSGRARITYKLSDDDARQIGFGIARAAEMHLAAGALEVFPQLAGRSLVRSKAELAAIDRARVRPADLRLEAFHPMGTARMGADRAGSVVAPSGESHELDGLYIADASILPSSLGVNPMITIMACARRIAAGIADRLSA